MKKISKIIFINILLICFLLLTTELLCCISKKEFLSNKSLDHLKKLFQVRYSPNNNIGDTRYRHFPYIEKNKTIATKAPIVLVGGSFTYGYDIDNNNTFDAQLKNKTNRYVYNLGICGGGPREILITLQNKELIKKIYKEPEYIIYTYIPDHKRRLYVPLAFLNANYKPIKNYTELKYYTPIWYIYKSFIYETIMNKIYNNKIIPNERINKFFNLYIKKINEEIKKQFGNNTKFIILIYYGADSHNWNEVEKQGIKVINLNSSYNIDTQQPEYKGTDNEHPNAKAWEVIVPALVKELDL